MNSTVVMHIDALQIERILVNSAVVMNTSEYIYALQIENTSELCGCDAHR